MATAPRKYSNTHDLKHLVKRELDGAERDVTHDKATEASVEAPGQALCLPDLLYSLTRGSKRTDLHVLLDYLKRATDQSLTRLSDT